ADGDGRFLLNQVETLFSIEIEQPLGPAELSDLLPRRVPVYDKDREGHYNLISALHKTVRGSDPEAALYYLARMLDAGEQPLYLRRPAVLTGDRRAAARHRPAAGADGDGGHRPGRSPGFGRRDRRQGCLRLSRLAGRRTRP